MENPRTINRFYFGLLVVYMAAAVAGSIWLGDAFLPLDAVAALAAIFGLFALATVANFIVFAPFVWLMARFVTGKQDAGNSRSGEQGD